MTIQHFIVGLLIACLALVFLLGWWIRRLHETAAPPSEFASTAAPPAATITATSAPGTPAAVRHRLAGTVIGDASYAVIEHPDGTNELYRPGQEVPGLGRLVRVEADRATFAGQQGSFDLKLAPAPILTPVPPSGPPSATPPAFTPTRQPPRAQSGRESSP